MSGFKSKQKRINKAIGIAMMLSALFYLLYPFLPGSAKSTLFIDKCLFKTATKLPCPGCGYDRAMNEAIHKNWNQAFHFHALFPFLVLLSVLLLIIGFKTALTGNFYTLPKALFYSIIALVLLSWVLKFILGPAYY